MTDRTANQALIERWPILANYIARRWSSALGEYGLEVGDVMGELAIRLSRAAPWDPKRGTIKRWLFWHCRRCVLDLLRKHSRRPKAISLDDGGAMFISGEVVDLEATLRSTMDECGPMTSMQRALMRELAGGATLRTAQRRTGATYDEARGVRLHLQKVCKRRTG